MPLPVTGDLVPDVLGGHEPHARSGRRVPPRVLGGGLAVALLAGVTFLAVQDDRGAAVVDASGSMVLDDRFSPPLTAVLPSRQYEGRDAVFAGSIHVELPDRQLDGEAELRFSWAATIEDGLITSSHSWGQVEVAFGAVTCRGPFAWSADRGARERGGSMSLRCDDGSLFAATALLEVDQDLATDRPVRLLVDLEDGSFVAGSRIDASAAARG